MRRVQFSRGFKKTRMSIASSSRRISAVTVDGVLNKQIIERSRDSSLGLFLTEKRDRRCIAAALFVTVHLVYPAGNPVYGKEASD